MYDILIFNNSTKKDYLFQGREDSSAMMALYHTFENLDLSQLPGGEYTVYLIRNDYGTAVTWDVKDVPLNSVLTYDGKQYVLSDLKPDIGLLKLGTGESAAKAEYRAKNEEYAFYRRR